ncbi:DUF3224 domain-containing protein [Neiella holothuriorum]|nr:DUF3224 domain-containing protein [Neiella holothuriorum]
MEGVFQITGWDETPYLENTDGSKKSHAKITQSYTGAIVGNSDIQYLMSYQADGSAVFVGLETITGTIEGRSGTVTLQHNGQFINGVASSEFVIVASSGTDELAAMLGQGSFISGEAGTANYQLNLEINE